MTNKELLDKIYDLLQEKTDDSFKKWNECIEAKTYNTNECKYHQGRTKAFMEAKDIIYDLYREVNE